MPNSYLGVWACEWPRLLPLQVNLAQLRSQQPASGTVTHNRGGATSWNARCTGAFSVSARSEEKQHVNWQSHEQKGRASTKEGLALVSLGARGPGAQTADAWNANGWSGALAELIRLSLQMSSGIQLHGLSRKSYKDSKGHHVERDAVSAPHHYMPGFLSVSLPLMSRLFCSWASFHPAHESPQSM